jgi:uncharacterized protein involved in cysteine biosynthesis
MTYVFIGLAVVVVLGALAYWWLVRQANKLVNFAFRIFFGR